MTARVTTWTLPETGVPVVSDHFVARRCVAVGPHWHTLLKKRSCECGRARQHAGPNGCATLLNATPHARPRSGLGQQTKERHGLGRPPSTHFTSEVVVVSPRVTSWKILMTCLIVSLRLGRMCLRCPFFFSFFCDDRMLRKCVLGF